LLQNTKWSNATNAQGWSNLIVSVIKKVMTEQTTSFGFAVIADEKE
jgi:hypothetical protein